MIKLSSVVLVPLGNLDNDVGGSVWHRLAAQPRFRRDARSHVQLVKLGVRGFIARFQTFLDDHMARRAGANSPTRMIQAGFDAFGNIQDAAGKAVVAVRDLRWIDFDGLAAGKKGHLIFLRRRRVFYFFDVWVVATHDCSPLLTSKAPASEGGRYKIGSRLHFTSCRVTAQLASR